MKPISRAEKEKILKRLFWDIEPGRLELDKLLAGDTNHLNSVEEQNLYRRLVMSCDWYTLLKVLPIFKIKTILKSSVIEELYPKDLKRRFIYARDVLSKQDLSNSG